MDAEVVIAGAGVIGLAAAHKISSKGHSVILLEKETRYGAGISSRNTETIHAGIYYQSGSLKAILCLKGKNLLYEHCERYKVKYKRTGKLFVAVTSQEISRLEQTRKQAFSNGLDDLVDLDEGALRKLEPDVKAKAALLSPSSGVFDSHGFMESLFLLGKAQGVILAVSSPLMDAESTKEGWNVMVGGSEPATISCKIVVNAAGLYAIDLSKKVFRGRTVPTLYPTKGSYVRYSGVSPVKHIIYPSIIPGVIEERVDASPDLAGSLRFGPNIEKCKNLEDFSLEPNLVEGMLGGIKRYLPNIDVSRLHPDCSGIRPKIYGPNDPVEDFRFDWAPIDGWLDLWGIESPGLTASLAIADHIYDLIKERDLL